MVSEPCEFVYLNLICNKNPTRSLKRDPWHGLNLPYHYFKYDSMQPYFMAHCIESLPQPFSNWKFNYRRQDLNPKPSEYQSNMLPTELSWLDDPWKVTYYKISSDTKNKWNMSFYQSFIKCEIFIFLSESTIFFFEFICKR